MNKLLVLTLLASHGVWAADSGQAVGGVVQAGKNAADSRPVKVLKKANSVRGSAQAIGQMTGGDSLSGVGRVVSGTSAIPLSVGAAVLSAGGAASAGAVGTDSTQPAPIDAPLEITSEIITVMPPNEALQQKPNTQLEVKPDKEPVPK